MSADLVIEAVGVRAGYARADGGRAEVLRGVDLAVAPGELVVLVGPNGGGKTTLLRCLAGTLQLSDGEARLFGHAVRGWSRAQLARRLAMLPQSLELPDGFRVAELVAMGRAPHARRLFGDTAEDEAAVSRAMVDADALELADRYPAELSGGERQRVLVAMALAQEPRLLLLDEPTLHLDVAHQAALLTRIGRLRRLRGLTVLAVLHDLSLATAFAPRVALLAEGRIQADGPPDHVLRPELVGRYFGLAMDEAKTADGLRFLVPRAPRASIEEAAVHDADEPFGLARSTPR